MQVITLETVDSTNLYAKNNIENLPDCTVIHAIRQTSGRGRFSRKWIDLGDGNLYMSFVLKPADNFREVYSNLTQYLSVVLAKTLESYGLEPQIKWPNDVLINGKKIAGILCEVVMESNKFKGLVLGIGVNLNATQEAVNSVPERVVTSLNLEIVKNVNMYEFLDKLTNDFFKDYEKFLNTGFEMIKSYYISKLVVLNKEISVQVINDVKSGLVKSVNDHGELVMEKDNKEFVLTIGDIL